MRTHFAKLLLAALAFTTMGVGQRIGAQETHPEELTANDLAETLSVHWWTVKLPENLGLKDMVGVELVSSDGKRLQGGGGFSCEKIGDKVRVFCWEDEASHQGKVMIKTPHGGFATTPYTDLFKDAAIGGASNGAVLGVGDILIKFDTSKHPSFTGGNVLGDGQVGLRVVVTKGPSK